MKFRMKKAWLPALGLTLALSTVGGVALGAGADDWYDGDNATVPDTDKTTVPLKLYNASGAEITSGSTTTPIAAFAAADGVVRTGDEYASLFVHLPQSSTAAGAWPGVQVTGTDKYTGTGAVTAPGAVAGKPFVRTTSAGYTLSDVKTALPNTETGASFAGVYELRLRTSSATNAVSNKYAATYVKITGTTWTVTTAPVPGDGPTTPPPAGAVATTTTATWPATLTYGAPASVSATVTPASGTAKPTGSVKLVSGTETVSTATLSAAGTASLAVPATLVPGSKSFTVVYDGAANAFTASSSAAKTIAVGKAKVSSTTLKVTKKPTVKKAGSALVTIATPSGLATATGKGTLTITKGKSVKKVVVNLKSGSATVKLKKLPKGAYTLVFSWPGDTYYEAATSKTVKVKSK